MIFQHTYEQVLDGTKTQTRRLVADNEFAWTRVAGNGQRIIFAVRLGRRSVEQRTKWEVGKDYAVQPGRSKKAVGRIRLLSIGRERVQDITEGDALAEGCVPAPKYIGDNRLYGSWEASSKLGFISLWKVVHTSPGTRWEDNPEVWVLEFELVEGGTDGE